MTTAEKWKPAIILFYASMICVSVRDSEGKFTKCRCAITDLTERKEMEEEIRRSRDELEIRVRELANGNEGSQVEIFQRRRAEESLRESEKQLRQLSYLLFMAQQAERKRIALELHVHLQAVIIKSLGSKLTQIQPGCLQ